MGQLGELDETEKGDASLSFVHGEAGGVSLDLLNSLVVNVPLLTQRFMVLFSEWQSCDMRSELQLKEEIQAVISY